MYMGYALTKLHTVGVNSNGFCMQVVTLARNQTEPLSYHVMILVDLKACKQLITSGAKNKSSLGPPVWARQQSLSRPSFKKEVGYQRTERYDTLPVPIFLPFSPQIPTTGFTTQTNLIQLIPITRRVIHCNFCTSFDALGNNKDSFNTAKDKFGELSIWSA